MFLFFGGRYCYLANVNLSWPSLATLAGYTHTCSEGQSSTWFRSIGTTRCNHRLT